MRKWLSGVSKLNEINWGGHTTLIDAPKFFYISDALLHFETTAAGSRILVIFRIWTSPVKVRGEICL